MQPLAELPDPVRHSIRGVFSDIDDTLSTGGRITSEAYDAMARLRASGILMIPITGRPAGWCDHIARMWPVDAVVGENGGIYMRHDDRAGRLTKRYVHSERERRANRERLETIGERILREVPGCALASDQPYRECDLAIDYCEDVPALRRSEVDRIVAKRD
jgi:phosphoserine phosphatase